MGWAGEVFVLVRIGEMAMRYYVKETNGAWTSLAIDDENNYSIATDADPSPDGYTDHQWGRDVAEWHEVDADAIRRLGHHRNV